MIRKSKLLLIISTFFFTVLFSCSLPAHAGVACTLCDIDNDGTIEPAEGQDDFNLFINILLGFPPPPSPQEFCSADLNVDGAVNGLDIQFWANVCAAPCPGGCDDNNPCTTDACNAGNCTHAPVSNGTSCADGTVCNGDEACQAGTCTAGMPLDCDDTFACTVDSCDPVNGCQYAPNHTLCDDGISCTEDICNESFGCTNTATQCGANPICIQCGPNQACNPSGSCVPTGICGNGIVDPGEECEADGDCTGGDVCAGCECVTSNFCGDGQITGDEVCDVNGDIGCASSEGYICAQTCLPDCSDCDPSGQPSCCGDNVEDEGEECDNGSFCDDGTECLYQDECLGIGDEICQYRAEFAGDCSQTCELIEDFVLADFNQNISPQKISNSRPSEFYSVKSYGECSYAFSRGDALNDPRGKSLKIDYDLESKQKPVCQVTVSINPKTFEIAAIDPNDFKTLKFYLKGSSQPFPKELKVEWRGATLVAHPVIAKNVATAWQLYEVPVSGELQPGESPEFTLKLERSTNPKLGTFYLDHLSLSRSDRPVWPSCVGDKCLKAQSELKSALTDSKR